MVVITLFVVLLMSDAYAETELSEITISIRGAHKAVALALLEAVAEETLIVEDPYNLAGQVVRRLVEGWLDAGVYGYEWDGRDEQGRVGSGVYVYRLRAGDKTFVGKVTLLR